ncbi:myrosinase 1-like [Achroia grisella]|uniref:myrosinase 1-like n=1 Tax=Achroia grisella TaxID=688607 RepID=UPI0027D24E0A|nr:myrosinase 1-like [Achroia grisella]
MRNIQDCFCKMTYWLLIIFTSLLGTDGWSDNRQRKFKDDFLFGAATSAYQVEGAWNIDGKSESIWDRYFHEHPEVVVDGRNGDVGSDSYHQYKRDVELLRELGVDFYRFSMSWNRILPTGFPNKINEKGIQYYDNLINELLKYNIEPVVTLFHFDLPQTLQDLGGWANPLCIEWFEEYARVVFDKYADKVKYWITVNQPNDICIESYESDRWPPAAESKGIGPYLCIKNVMLAHANVYRLYVNEYKNKYKGSVGISLAVNWLEPLNNKTENVEAVELYREFTLGLFINPIWSKEGDFPQVVKDIVAKRSKEQGFTKSRLPILSKQEIKLLKGSSDFLGINHYTTSLVSPSSDEFPSPSIADDVRVQLSKRSEWKIAKSPWLASAPYGIYKACIHINLKYDYPPVFITEHGWSTDVGLQDEDRAYNLREYMKAILLAIEDGTNLKGYTAWSLIDNVEWSAGTSERFGLYEVDFDSDDKTRTPRLSAHVYKRLIKTRVVEENWKPKSMKMKISDRKFKEPEPKAEL